LKDVQPQTMLMVQLYSTSPANWDVTGSRPAASRPGGASWA